MPARASGVVGADMPAGVQIGGRLGRLGRVLGEVQPLFLTNLSRIGVAMSMLHVLSVKAGHLPVCDGIVAAVAPAELRSFVDRDPTEDLRAGTRDCVAHAAAVAETHGEEVRRVDTVVVLDQLDHVVDEGQVLSAGVRPAGVEPIGRDEDRAVVRQFLKSVVGHDVPIRSAAVDFLGVAAIPVKPEDQPVGVVLVVVVGKPHGEAPAAALNRDVAALDRCLRSSPTRPGPPRTSSSRSFRRNRGVGFNVPEKPGGERLVLVHADGDGVGIPVAAPLQPVNVAPLAGTAVTATDAPES